MTGKHALVFGASGITGWAIVNELLTDHSDAKKFTKVTALTNRRLSPNVARWAESPKLTVISGIDLLQGSQEDLQEEFKSSIPYVDSVTHIFFNGMWDCSVFYRSGLMRYQQRINFQLVMNSSRKRMQKCWKDALRPLRV
jgi:hypothetical protein